MTAKPPPPTVDDGASDPEKTLVDVEAPTDKVTKDELVGQAASDFPDGGLSAWLTVLGFFCISFVTWGNITSFGTFQRYLTSTYIPSTPQSSVAWISGLQLFGLFIGGIVVGKLFDRGYCRIILLSGSIIHVLCSFLASICTEFWQLLLCQGVGLGIAFGLLFVTGVSAVGHYFRRRRALALGIGAVGSSIGSIIIPIQLHEMFKTTGWGWSVRVLAFIMLALLIVANLCIKTRLPPKTGGPLLDFRCFKDVTFAIYAVGVAFISFGLYIPMTFGPGYAASKGVGDDLSFYVIAFLGAGSIAGRIFPNALADRIGILNVLFGSCLISAVLIFVWLACDNTVGIIVFNVFYGFFTGAYVSGTPAGVAALTVDMRDLGTRNGMLFFGTAFTGLAGVPIGGALVAISYAAAACFAASVVLFGAACVGVAWWRQRRKVGSWKV